MLPTRALLLIAAALNIPGIQGHMTDPTRQMSDAAKAAVEDKLGKIAEDTHIDAAGWITNAPEDQVDALGNEAYKRWSIGVWWDNGVFFAFPATGRVHIIQDKAKPELNAAEVAKLAAADNPNESDYQKRIERLADVEREILIPKTEKKARPWGTNRPGLGNEYLAAAFALALAGVVMSVRRKRRTDGAVVPVASPTPAPTPAPAAPSTPAATPTDVSDAKDPVP